MKYILIKCISEDGFHHNIPILFPEILVHELVFKSLLPMLQENHQSDSFEVIGAGDFDSNNLSLANFKGYSESLGVKSRGEEDRLIFSSIDRFGMFL